MLILNHAMHLHPTDNPGTNGPPTTTSPVLDTQEDTPITFSASQLLQNASDPDGDALAVTSVAGATTAGGSAVRLAGGDVLYTPVLNFFGTDLFNFTISDGINSITATAIVAVASVNDPPTVPGPVNVTTTRNTPLLITNAMLLAGVTDVDGGTPSVASVPNAAGNGSVAAAAGGYTYSPSPGFVGSDSLLVTLTDGQSGFANRTVLITVTRE